MNKLTKTAVMVATCLAVGFISGQATRAGVETWFPTINKPSFNPPGWVFAPVWTVLYILMGVAAGMVWDHIDRQRETVRKGLTFFTAQLALNALWSFLFFGLHNPLLAFIEIIILWLMIFETFNVFRRVDRTAANLLLPYLAWVSFATVLNGTIWWLNR